MSGLLLFVSSLLVNKALVGCHLEAVALVLPQFVNRPLPILVGAFCVGTSPKKNGPHPAISEAACQQPACLCKVLVGAIPCCKWDTQHWLGD
jgi:hypothetical protein